MFSQRSKFATISLLLSFAIGGVAVGHDVSEICAKDPDHYSCYGYATYDKSVEIGKLAYDAWSAFKCAFWASQMGEYSSATYHSAYGLNKGLEYYAALWDTPLAGGKLTAVHVDSPGGVVLRSIDTVPFIDLKKEYTDQEVMMFMLGSVFEAATQEAIRDIAWKYGSPRLPQAYEWGGALSDRYEDENCGSFVDKALIQESVIEEFEQHDED